MAVHQLEITTENLLNAVVQMPEKEFNRFVENARKLRTKNKNSTKEAELIYKINSVFENFPRQRYDELNAKFESNTLSKDEYEELLGLSDKSEILNAKRLGYIAEIAKIRHQTLEEVMHSLGIKTARK
jgi:hypothetical protein